jgi:hypothetical protein
MSVPGGDQPLQVVPQTAQDVARELISQPQLFSFFDGEDGFSPTPAAVQRYTGERSTGDDQRNLFVGAMRLLGASDRQIEDACKARGFGLTRRTIPLILEELERSQRITPLKQRLALAIGDNAERANIALRVLLDKAVNGTVDLDLAAMIKAVGTVVGITTEKYLLTTGQATEIVETRTGAGREAFDQWWKEAVAPIQATVTPAVDAPPSDSTSAETPPVSEEIAKPEPFRDGSDTATRLPEDKRMDGDQDPPPDRGGGDVANGGGPEQPTSS